MATITTLAPASTDNTHVSAHGNVKLPYLVEKELNYATALTAKGSALASADVIELIRIPAGTVVLGAGAQILVAGDSTTLTLHVGTGADNDEWVASLDGKATAGTYGTDLDAVPAWNTYTTTDTIDVTFATLTGTLATGKVRVYALLMDVSDAKGNTGGSGIAVIGS
jgi:hypothetical protein